jgi:hypothetical protein
VTRAAPSLRRGICPGIPTIRVFEALACGIPLVSAPWSGAEALFSPGPRYLVAETAGPCGQSLQDVLHDDGLASAQAQHGRATILARPTCAHRRRQPARHPRLRSILAPEECTPEPRMSNDKMDIAFFGSSLVSAFWNGAATYYRGIVPGPARARPPGPLLRARRVRPAAAPRHRRPDWARVIVYPGEGDANALRMVEHARGADLVVKASGVGVFDALLERAVLDLQGPSTRVVFWDVDAPATLDRMRDDPGDPFRPGARYDLVLTTAAASPSSPPTAALAPASVFPSTTPSIRRRTTPCRPSRASRPISASSATGSPTARRASRSSSCALPRRCRNAASC